MKKYYLAMALIVCVCMLFGACTAKTPSTSASVSASAAASATQKASAAASSQAPSAAAKSYKIGVFVKDTTNTFWRYVVNGAKEEAKKLGVEVVEYAPVEASNVEEQINQIEDAVEAKIDAVCIVAIDSNAVQAALKKAIDAKIPVVTFNSRVTMDGIACFVGVENYEGECLVAEQVFKDINYKGKIVVLEGVVSGYANTERVRAITDTAKKYSGIEILTSQVTDNKRDKAVTVMENLLQKYSKIDAVMAHNDNVGLGALQAIKDANRQSEMIIAGFDGTKEGMESILAGGLKYSLDQSPYQQGAYSVRAAVALLKGEKVEKEIPTGGTLVTKANAQSIIDEFYSTK